MFYIQILQNKTTKKKVAEERKNSKTHQLWVMTSEQPRGTGWCWVIQVYFLLKDPSGFTGSHNKGGKLVCSCLSWLVPGRNGTFYFCFHLSLSISALQEVAAPFPQLNHILTTVRSMQFAVHWSPSSLLSLPGQQWHISVKAALGLSMQAAVSVTHMQAEAKIDGGKKEQQDIIALLCSPFCHPCKGLFDLGCLEAERTQPEGLGDEITPLVQTLETRTETHLLLLWMGHYLTSVCGLFYRVTRNPGGYGSCLWAGGSLEIPGLICSVCSKELGAGYFLSGAFKHNV